MLGEVDLELSLKHLWKHLDLGEIDSGRTFLLKECYRLGEPEENTFLPFTWRVYEEYGTCWVML